MYFMYLNVHEKYEMEENLEMKKVASLILVIVLSLAACATAFAADPIRFALCGPMTGDQSEQGNNQLRGAQIAVDEINEAGGINGQMLEIVAFDDLASPNQAVIVAEKIAADPSIQFVVAHINSGCTVAAMPIYTDAGLAVLGPVNSMDDLSNMPWDNYFRMCLSDGTSCKVMIDVVKEDTDFQHPAVFYANTANDLSAASIYKGYLESKYGFTNIPMETFNPDTDKDFSSQIEKFKAAGVDAIFISAEYTPTGLLCVQSHEKGFFPAFGATAANNPAIFDLAGKDLNNCMYTMSGFFANDPDPEIQRISKKYREKYNSEPNDTVTRGYDAVYVAKDALENGATKETLAEYFAGTTDMVSLGSRYIWNGHIDNQKATTCILKIVDGEYTLSAKGVYPEE